MEFDENSKVVDIKNHLKSLKLNYQGNKKQCLERLRQHHEQAEKENEQQLEEAPSNVELLQPDVEEPNVEQPGVKELNFEQPEGDYDGF